MPLTAKGKKIMGAMKKIYGKKGESVFYASKNKGTITGVESDGSLLKQLLKTLLEQHNKPKQHVRVKEGYKQHSDTTQYPEGTKVKARKEYGGDTGTIKHYAPSGKFVVVKTKKGDKSYHISDVMVLEQLGAYSPPPKVNSVPSPDHVWLHNNETGRESMVHKDHVYSRTEIYK